MKKIIRKMAYLFFPSLKKYHRFMKSQSCRVSFLEYVRFCLSYGHKNKGVYWPVHKNSTITHPNNIFIGINSSVGAQPGCYIQGNGGIRIGNYVLFASNIGIISANHDLYHRMQHVPKEVRIDDYSWIGMNAIILPGVHLGPCTIVGAGSVVTKSFPKGYCVIGGNPAKVIKELDSKQFVPTEYKEEFYGFIPKEEFKSYAEKFLRYNHYYEEIMEELKMMRSL